MSRNRAARLLIFAAPALAAAVLSAKLLSPSPAWAEPAINCPEPAQESAMLAAERILCLVDGGATLEAITYGEAALERWQEGQVLSALGRAYDDAGDSEKALALQEQAHAFSPEDPLIAYRLASLLADEVDRLAPLARGDRVPKELAHCFPEEEDKVQAVQRFRDIAARADGLYHEAIAGLARTRREDDIVTLNARMERALLHVTTDGETALPEIEAVASDFRWLAGSRQDAALSDMASGLLLNLAQSYATLGKREAAARALEEALSVASSADQKRVIEAAAPGLRDSPRGEDLVAVAAGTPDCTIRTVRALPERP